MSGFVRLTVNLYPPGSRALDRLAVATSKTGAVNVALRLVDTLRPLADERGGITVVGTDGRRTRVVVS